MTDMFPEEDMGFPESKDEGYEEEPSNRTFIIAASVLGGIILLSLICVAAYALVLAPRKKQQTAAAESTRVAQNTQVADMLTATFVAEAMAMTPDPTATILPSPTASSTPVIAQATHTPTSTPDTAVTETLVAVLMTKQAAEAANLIETPVALPTELADTGFADDVGIPSMLGMVVLLLVVIFLARRLRQANT